MPKTGERNSMVKKIKIIKKGTIINRPPSESKKDETKVSFSPLGNLIPKRLERKLQQKELWEADKASRLLRESEERKANAIRLLFGE
jgi:hypothetical protein